MRNSKREQRRHAVVNGVSMNLTNVEGIKKNISVLLILKVHI